MHMASTIKAPGIYLPIFGIKGIKYIAIKEHTHIIIIYSNFLPETKSQSEGYFSPQASLNYEI